MSLARHETMDVRRRRATDDGRKICHVMSMVRAPSRETSCFQRMTKNDHLLHTLLLLAIFSILGGEAVHFYLPQRSGKYH